MTVQQIINAVMDFSVPPEQRMKQTCDKLMAGSGETEASGVATTFMATIDVIRETARIGANFIITHEPTWWSGADDTGWLENDPLYREKKALIEREKIAIWRYHDHMHMHQPDAIYAGILKELGWEQYARTPGKPVFGSGMPGGASPPFDFAAAFNDYYNIPETTLAELSVFFKQKLGMKTVRIIGDPEMRVSRVGILVGGGSLGLGQETMPMRVMRKHDIQVMVCGDITEWTLPAYVNDARQLGQKRALLIIGHERSEEWGMKHMAEWLPDLIGGLPVTFVDAKEPFGYL
jgi:putative NIF3 family GTP cyclohydrolase 1 type 2